MALFKRRMKPVKLNALDELDPMLASGRPVLLDFYQHGCGPCKVMDGIVNELAEEFGESAHVVKVNVATVAGAAQAFKVRSTPTFVLLGQAPNKKSRAAKRPGNGRVTTRWRGSGLVKKDFLQRMLESNGAVSLDG